MISKRNSIIAAISIIAIALIVAVVVLINLNSAKNNDTKDNSTSQTNTSEIQKTDNTVKIYDNAYLQTFSGSYDGTGALFSGAFQFPQARFTLNENNTFAISYSGLDLIVTQSPALKVGDTYPVALLNAQGVSSIQASGEVALSVQNISISFTVAGQPVDEATSTSLQTSLKNIFNLIIPNPTSANPLEINTTFVGTQEGKLNITSQAGVANQIYIYFDGQKTN